ncbi:hypothetical protein F3Y22_tig00111810pilonHSYRG00254 [Hibiscus syriacus]|uniref:Uncharacterized protein n=1 Tax=Hibiscus syriacus TaxID=106335 RepID=A0A6A2YCR0_HIBSY|nr:hypothetical protein F3Y22_tig00111810pilonHSYRG00254 [Hibiscus syriacus]
MVGASCGVFTIAASAFSSDLYPGSKSMKQVGQHILNYAIKAAGEGVPELSKESSDIFIWCLTQNLECYNQWDALYIENLEASVTVLRNLFVEHSTVDPPRET